MSYSQPGCIVNLVFSASVLCCMCWGCVCICWVACDVCWWWCWWLWWSVCAWWCCTNLSFRLLSKNSRSATTSDKIRPPMRMKKMPATFFSESSLRDVSCFSVGSHSVFSNHHLLNSSVSSPLSINDNIARLIGTLIKTKQNTWIMLNFWIDRSIKSQTCVLFFRSASIMKLSSIAPYWPEWFHLNTFSFDAPLVTCTHCHIDHVNFVCIFCASCRSLSLSLSRHFVIDRDKYVYFSLECLIIILCHRYCCSATIQIIIVHFWLPHIIYSFW